MLSKATIANFKAFGEEQTARFACVAATNASKLSLLVGPNNSGKSSLLNAVERLLTADHLKVFTATKEDRHGDRTPTLKVWHGGKEISILPNAGSKFSIQGDIESIRQQIKYVPSRRPWSEYFGGAMTESDYTNSYRANIRSNRYWLDSSFGAALMSMYVSQDKKGKFDALLQQVDPAIKDWRVETSGTQDYIEYLAESSRWHRMADVGDGVSSLFRICFEILSLRDGDLLMLDEPELSLHPQIQRTLARMILAKSFNNQFIVATHSPHFVSWKSLKSGATICRLNMTASGAKLSMLSSATLKKITAIADTDRKNVMLYDAVAKEVFFSRGALFVEGAEDANILRSYIEVKEMPEIEIFGYGSGGAANLATWLSMCEELGIHAFGLYDGDGEGSKHHADALAKFRGNAAICVDKLWTEDIRDKPAQDGKTAKVGIFDANWQIKPTHEASLVTLLSRISRHINPQVAS